MRINKMLSNKGICSRKQAHELILAQRIKVNGQLCLPGQWVEACDEILLDEKPLCEKEKVYLLLNKPRGITCTAAEEVADNIIDYMAYKDYIFPVGRLDKDSQGLILLTNDGDLANQILAAENEHEKEYLVTVDRAFDEAFIKGMAQGVQIGKVMTRACEVIPVTKDSFRIILTQGLNKQIRKMSKAFGYNVLRLERIRLLHLTGEGLEYGKWRPLTEEEVQGLKNVE